ncbi:F-box protein At5g67140 isoform X2 [Cajanus cajan]|uniref:F-box protein At5g67140 isoform X2 n=1 Tax=Cajanus cajan TaxID=3821 RepID=UPI00098DD517|nr:F-box protein At5g67140 isoform X2 [Cajanus cajan]
MIVREDIMEVEAEIDRLPIDLLAHIFVMFTSFTDLAQASGVCKKWKQGVMESLARRHNLSFAGWKMDDDSTARLVYHAYNLTKLDIPMSRWGCQITDAGLLRISFAKCVSNLTSISLWGLTGITDEGVVQLTIVLWSCHHVTERGLLALVDKCLKLKSMNVWGTRVPEHCFNNLLILSPALQIKL